MNEAYNLKELGDKLKSKGLNVAEDAAKIIVEEVFIWIAESAQLSANKYDDLISVLIPMIKPHILTEVDKIDKEVG